MSFVRPEVRAAVHRWREAIVGVLVTLPGLWIAGFGGFFWIAVGGFIVVAGLALAVNAVRRVRFGRERSAPGVVQAVEGQIAYFAPDDGGGFAALGELEELRLLRGAEGQLWVLVQSDGSELRIPVAAGGAEVLFDAFATLPGIDMQAVVSALDQDGVSDRVLWRRRRRAALT